MSVDPQWEKKYIRLACDSDKPVFVEAEVFGGLALHKPLGPNPDGLLTLTHVGTGLAIMTFDRICGKAAAELLAGLDWNFDKPDGCPASTKKGTVRILRKLERLIAELVFRPRRASQLVAAFRNTGVRPSALPVQALGTNESRSHTRARSKKKEPR